MYLKKNRDSSLHSSLWTVVTPLPVIAHQCPSAPHPSVPLLSPLSSRWLCMLPCSGLRRGPLERLRRSGGDRQCSRHHTQPGRTTLCMYQSGVPSSWSVTSFPLMSFLPVLLLCFCFAFLGLVCLFEPLLARVSHLMSTIDFTHGEISEQFQHMLLKVLK